MPVSPPFHLAFAVTDIEATRAFYVEKLGCKVCRSAERWIDFDFFGHQLVIHQKDGFSNNEKPISNPVDGHDVPIPHFGVVLEWDTFHKFSEDLKEKRVEFIIEPYIRFEGQPGEQATMFFMDPAGNALEFKSFKDFNQIFAT